MLLCQWQGKPEVRADVGGTFNANCSMVLLYNGLADVESQAQADIGTARGTEHFDARGTVETLPNLLLFKWGEADSLIAYRDCDGVRRVGRDQSVPYAEGCLDRSLLRRVLEGVGEV